MPHEANIGCKTDSRQEMLRAAMDSVGAEWYFNIPTDLNGEVEEEILPLARPGERAMYAASFIVFFIHVLGVILPAFAERSAEGTNRLPHRPPPRSSKSTAHRHP